MSEWIEPICLVLAITVGPFLIFYPIHKYLNRKVEKDVEKEVSKVDVNHPFHPRNPHYERTRRRAKAGYNYNGNYGNNREVMQSSALAAEYIESSSNNSSSSSCDTSSTSSSSFDGGSCGGDSGGSCGCD